MAAQALYILGDLFDAWVGDDDLSGAWAGALAQALRRVSDSGVEICVMHGNRDFLLGERFAAAAGARLLPDPYRIDLHGIPTLLSHGDALCTDDLDYQRFRALIRSPDWVRAFLAKPLAERHALATHLREQSETAKRGKSMISMDADIEAIHAVCREQDCSRLIHGHTHRPGRHDFRLEGRACERWVLPDWYGEGGYLHCDGDGCHLVQLDCHPA